MPLFLSPEWIAALDAAAREAAVPAGVRLTIQQIVTDDAGGDVCYHLVLDDGRLRVHPGEAPAADVTLVQSREVAAALSRGELNAQQALEAGRLKLRGDIGHLAREGRALTAVEDVFAAVRATTSYEKGLPPDPGCGAGGLGGPLGGTDFQPEQRRNPG